MNTQQMTRVEDMLVINDLGYLTDLDNAEVVAEFEAQCCGDVDRRYGYISEVMELDFN